MKIKVSDIMIPDVIVATPYDTVGGLREVMLDEGVHAIPVVDGEYMPLGILTSSDLMKEVSPNTFVCEVMTPVPVFTVPKYSDIHVAARIMRNHKLHHVVVTHEKQLVGILSTFDFLQLVDEHRFELKNAPTESKRHGDKRS
ncbi:MAG: CBS domain-containing protein [Proteobacteria bacterium]|nr:CBS domain-containing protein [Pseudomonadota bacterium]